MAPLTRLEREAIEMFLAGKHPALPAFREQLAHSTVANRKLEYASEVELNVDPSVPDAPLNGRFMLGGVHADVPGLQRGVGFSLYIDGGRLRGLDAITFDEPWPQSWPQIPSYRLVYSDKPALLDRYAK